MPTMFAQVAHLVICESSGSAADFGALTEHVAERLRVFPLTAAASPRCPSRSLASPRGSRRGPPRLHCAERLPAVIDNALRSLVI